MQEKSISVTELVGMYLTVDGKVNPWFKRKLNEQPVDVREEVNRQIREKKLDERRSEIHTQFKLHGFSSKVNQPTSRRIVVWTDAEWDQLADLVWRARKKNPVPPIGSLIKKALAQFPADRKRNLSGGYILPLTERLARKDEILFRALDELAKIKAKLGVDGEIHTKEEILSELTDEEIAANFKERILKSLTDEEVCLQFRAKIIQLLSNEEIIRHFKEKVLEQIPEEDMIERYQSVILDYLSPSDIVDQFETEDILACLPTSSIVGYIAKQFVERFEGHGSPLKSLDSLLPAATGSTTIAKPQPKPSIPAVRTIAPPQKKKITIVGMKPNQAQIIRGRFGKIAEFIFVDKNMKGAGINNSCDIIVLWGSFVSHSDQIHAKSKKRQLGCELITHHGGMDKLMERLEKVLA